jgi:hypothetical protein
MVVKGREALSAASFDVFGGAWFALRDAGQHDVPAGAFASVGWQGGDTTELGERGLGAYPFRVVIIRDKDRRSYVGADP